LTDQPDCDLTSEPDSPDDFFRNVNIQFLVHELKGPLDVIQTNIRMLLEMKGSADALTPFQERSLRRSIRSAAKMRDVIHSLLEVGSSQTGRITVQEFSPVQPTIDVLVNSLETVLCGETDAPDTDADPTEFLSQNNVRLIVPPEIKPILLKQDKAKFRYILGNLVRNGLAHRRSKLEVELALGGSDLFITVTDDGPGIEDHNALFHRYAQKSGQDRNRHRGHGLGLASSKIMAHCLGGDVTVETHTGEGARFLLTLPLQADDPAGPKG